MGQHALLIITGGEGTERRDSVASGSNVTTIVRRLGLTPISVDASELLRVLASGEAGAAVVCIHGRTAIQGLVHSTLRLASVAHAGPPPSTLAVASSLARVRALLRYHNIPTIPHSIIGGQGTTRAEEVPFTFPVLLRDDGDPLDMGEVAPTLGRLNTLVLKRGSGRPLVIQPHTSHEVVAAVAWGGKVISVAAVEPESLAEHELSPLRLRTVQTLATRAAALLGAQDHPVVVTFRMVDGEPAVDTINPIPSLAPSSLFMRLMSAAGWSEEDTVASILSPVLRLWPLSDAPVLRE